MADYSFGTEEETAELKKLNAEVVRSDPNFVACAGADLKID